MAKQLPSKQADYDSLINFHREEVDKRKESRLIFQAKDIKFGISKHGAACRLVNPELGFNTSIVKVFIRVIPPMSKDGNHRHREEAILHVLRGRGYSVIDGKRFDWKVGDTICVPPWSWHQHFNTDPEEPARLIAGTNSREMRLLSFSEFEQGEEKSWKEEDVRTDLF